MRKVITQIFVFGFFALIVTLPHSPLFMTGAGIDQGVYQYVGNSILDGHAPYVDAWDHKQPLIYFIYAIGSLITGRTLWGVWLIEFICLWMTGILAFNLLTLYCNRFISYTLVIVSVFVIWSFSGISNPEQLALPFYLLTLLLYYRLYNLETKTKETIRNSVLLGIVFAGCFFLKQSLIAIPAAICITYFLHIVLNKKWKRLINFLWIGAGFLIVSAILLGYLAANRILVEYWNAAFVFNFMYSATGLTERLISTFDQIEILTLIPLMIITFGLWICMCFVYLASQSQRIIGVIKQRYFSSLTIICGAILVTAIQLKRILQSDNSYGILDISIIVIGIILVFAGVMNTLPKIKALVEKIDSTTMFRDLPGRLSFHKGLLPVALIALPLVLFFNSISGEHYDYYNTTLFPEVIILFSIFITLMSKNLDQNLRRIIIPAAVIGLAVICVYNPVLSLILQYRNRPEPDYLKGISYIQDSTQQDDTIYVWGKKTSIYSSANRYSPTRYFYQLGAVDWQPYAERFSVIDEITSTFENNKPALFIVTSDLELGTNKAQCLQATEHMGREKPIFDFMCQNYAYAENFGGMRIFKLNP